MLHGKRLLVSGVATRDSIAAAVVERSLRAGAEVVVAAYPKDVPAAQEVLSALLEPTEVVAVDATSESDLTALEDDLRHRWGRLDGALHAIASHRGPLSTA